MRHLVKWLILAASLVWAAAVLIQADLPGAWHDVVLTTSPLQRGLLAILFLIPAGLACWVETHGWIATFGARRPEISFSRLFCIRLAGEAVNQATPFMSLGGEPVKAMLVAAETEAMKESAASVAAARFVMTLAQVLLVSLGLVVGYGPLHTSPGALVGFGLFPLLLGAFMLLLLAAYLVVPASARKRLLDHPRLERFQEGMRLVGGVLNFWRAHPRQFAWALACFVLGWAAMGLEFWVVARIVGVPLTLLQAVALEGLMNSVTMATFFIPGNLGSQEAGLLFLGRLFVLGPVGPLMVVLRRAREVLLILLGLLCLAVLGGGAMMRLPGLPAPAAGSEQR